jgi:hypothetical protein
MLCSCGRPHATLLAERIDADQQAIDDLSKQASGPTAELTKAKVNELKAEVKAEAEMLKALKRGRAEMLQTLRAALDLADPQTLLALPRDRLLDFVLRGGLGLAVDDFIAQQERIAEAALASISQVVEGLTTDSVQDQIDALAVASADAVFQDVILPDTLKSVREALEAMVVGVPANQAITALSQRLEKSEGRQLTEVRTKLSQYGRNITAVVAEAADLDLYLYTGPRDGITRDFCRALINKVVDEKQMRSLSNGQGLPVKTSGGGYNCRHSWSPITEGFMVAAKLKKATASDIAKANAGAR